MKKNATLFIGIVGSVVLSASSVMCATEIETENDIVLTEDISEADDFSIADDVFETDIVEEEIFDESIVEDDFVYETEAVSETSTIDFEDVELIEECSQELFAGATVDPNILVNGTNTVSTIEEALQLLDAEYPNTIQLLDNVEGDISIPSGTEVKLDLNGKRLTTTQITNAGTLSIYDSTSGKRGNIYSVPSREAYLVVNSGTLSITDTSLILSNAYYKQEPNYYAVYRTTAYFIDNTGTCNLQNVKEIIEQEQMVLYGSSKKSNTVIICGLRNQNTATVDGLSLTGTLRAKTSSNGYLYYSSNFIENGGTLNYLSGTYNLAFDKSTINTDYTQIKLFNVFEIWSRASGSIVNIGKDDGIVDGTFPAFNYGIWTLDTAVVNLYDGDFSNIDTSLIENIGYNAITYTVNFFTDESTLLSTNAVRFGDELDVPAEPVPPEHYTFEGWTEKNGGDYWDKGTTFKKIYRNADYIADFQPIIIKQVLFADDEVIIKEGETYDLGQLVSFRPADYGSDDTVVWTSSNQSMATVDGDGVVTGVSAGQSTVTVTLVANTTINASKLVNVEHDWDTDYTIDKEATCTTNGSKSIHCKACGGVKPNSSVSIPAAHKWASVYTVDREAICTEDGSKSIHCTTCGTINSETVTTIPAAHKWSTDYTIDSGATCTVDGSKSIHCTVCGSTKPGSSVVIPAAHKWSTEYTVDSEATCTTDGSKSIHCTVCGTPKPESSISIPAAHKWATEYTIDNVATCTVDGSKSYHCTVCGAVKPGSSVTIPATHTWSTEYTVDEEATCTVDGSKSIHCSVCGAMKPGSSVTLPASHTWETDYTVDVRATCTVNGSESIHCSVCGESKPRSARTIEASGHHMTVHDENAPTCTKAGNEEYFYCDNCRKYYRDENGVEEISLSEVRIAPYGHRQKKIEAKPATCAATGNTEYYYCNRCKKYFEDEEYTIELTLEEITIPINSLAHDWDEGVQTTAPTCTQKGVKTYTCLNDGSHTKTESIPLIGHDWNVPTYTWADNNSTVTASRVCKHDSRHVESETVNPTYVEAEKATCAKSGKGVYTATFNKDCFITQRKEVAVPATGIHTPITDSAVPATTTSNGFTQGSHCSVCGKILVEQKIIPKLSADATGETQQSVSQPTQPAQEQITPAEMTVTAKGLKNNKLTLKKGKSVKLKVTGSTGKVTFKSSKKKVASVSKAGKVKALKKGKSTITVSAGGKTIKIKLTVK